MSMRKRMSKRGLIPRSAKHVAGFMIKNPISDAAMVDIEEYWIFQCLMRGIVLATFILALPIIKYNRGHYWVGRQMA